MFKHTNELLRNPFWSVVAVCVTAIVWLLLSYFLSRVPAWQHQEAFRQCAQQLNLQALDKSQAQFMAACLLRNGYKDDF